LIKPASTIGVNGENYWIKTDFQHDNVDEQTEAVLAGKPQYAYMSFPSAKSGDHRFHTVEVLALVRSSAFSTWSTTTHSTRGKEYLELKTRITNGLLDLADSATPGLKALVEYSELSTPLSMYDYTSHPGGTIYGLKGTPKRYASPLLTTPPPITGLHLTGADVSSLGISGAMIGGVLAASRVLGSLGFIRIMMAARKVQPITEIPLTAAIRSPEKKRAVLLSKAALTPFIWKLDFELPEPVAFAPGQFAMLRVAPWEWRNYSIASVEGKRLSLLVSTRTGGDGSLFAANVQPSSETEVELPFGSFQLQRNSHRRVFLATGTGIAPFLPMFEELETLGQLHTSELLFGCSFAGDDITGGLKSLPRTTVCVSRDTSVKDSFHGRVTEVLKDLKFDPSSTDFYLCGAPAMIDDSRAILAQAGATQVLVEPF
jgi:ferredoxin-NADP reductase